MVGVMVIAVGAEAFCQVPGLVRVDQIRSISRGSPRVIVEHTMGSAENLRSRCG